MKLTSDPFILIGHRGEVITVDIQSVATVHSVAYELGGGAQALILGQRLTFTLDHDPTILSIFFSFSNPQGGVYKIRIVGTGEVSEYSLKQAPNPGSSATLTYRFDLGGDETKPGY
jgi:hypothetical protein